MALVANCKCSKPKLVWNKYIKDYIFVSCGKCTACRRAHQSVWVQKLTQEAECHLYNYELELDYVDKYLPRYDFSDDGIGLIEVTTRLENYYQHFPEKKFISFKELYFKNKSDHDYFVDRLNSHFSCIPHASVYDIQKFKKRLNTIIAREITGHYSNFRSAVVSELGDTTLRPHYHGILYFDDSRLLEPAIDSDGERIFLKDKDGKAFPATKLDWFVDRAWRTEDNHRLGHAYVNPSRGELASYIAKYVGKPADLPSFYEHPSLRPIFLTSRKPALGSLLQSKTKILEIFNNSSPSTVEFEKQGELYVPKRILIGQSFENKIFPKCISYGKISSFDRLKLYSAAISEDGSCLNYNDFIVRLVNRVFDGLSFDEVRLKYYYCKSIFEMYNLALDWNDVCFKSDYFSELIKYVTRGFEKERSLLSLHSVSSRVYWQSKVFDVGIRYYVSRIEEYYDRRKPISVLRRFYETQNDVLKQYPDYDIRNFYPLSYFRENVDPSLAPDAIIYQKHSLFKFNEVMKNKFKNDYFEKKLKYKDPILHNLLEKYYAQKCNENVEAISHIGT